MGIRQSIKRKKLILKHGNKLSKLSQLIINLLYISYSLVINFFYYLKLLFHKRWNKIEKPIIHYYAICWNEELILPFVYDYYNKFVDHFIIYDNYSTDGSCQLLAGYSNVEIIKFDTGNKFDDVTHIKIKNKCWKKSRGKADYVIVCDVDEFIYHPNFDEFISKSLKNKISFFKPLGYNMYSDFFPEYKEGINIVKLITKGVFDRKYCKSIIFDPHQIVDINYAEGAHLCAPWGIIKSTVDTKLKLLHYKNIGLKYILSKKEMYKARLSETNIENKFGVENLVDESDTIEDFNINYQGATRII